MIRLLTTPLLLVAIAGCGGGDKPAPRPSAPRYLGADDLRRDLANGFRAGLYKLAVMSQPPDAAADLGQSLPTGLVDTVACRPGAARPAGATAWPWRCSVRWETAAGRPRSTRYTVRLLPTGCFAAGADPRMPAHRDTTIASFSEHPLNAITSVRRGC
jgi:hypothetical protein